MESNVLRTVISRMKKSQGVSESSDGIIYDSILALERENDQKDERKNFHSLQEKQKSQNQPREEII